jgi:SAM-dependent methyltransferase
MCFMPVMKQPEGAGLPSNSSAFPDNGHGLTPVSDTESKSSLEDIRRNWEGFGKTDPLWAICSDESRRHGKWNKEEFFSTGRNEMETVWNYLKNQGLHPAKKDGQAMDFGCGVGRLSRALALYFERVHGVDIAASMIEQARKWNQGERCEFHHNKDCDLRLFANDRFDFIYSSIVLQHIPQNFVRGYLAEFVRVLKPGGYAVFQLPSTYREIPRKDAAPESQGFLTIARRKLALRHRANTLLKSLRLNGDEGRREECKMEMHGIPEPEVRELIARMGAKVLDAATTNSTDPDFNGNLKFLEKEPESGWVSKQYCVTK